MKITHISLYPPKGELHCDKSGVAPYTKNLATNIPYLENDEVSVIGDIDSNIENYSEENYSEENISVHKVFSKGIFFYKDILKKIDEIQPDVVHVQQELALYGNILSAITLRFLLQALQKRGIKTVITFHGIVDVVSIDEEFMKENFSALPIFMVKFAFKFIFNPLIKYSNEIIVHEELFKKRILEQYYKKSANNIHVIHHGIEDFTDKMTTQEARAKIGLGENEKVLMFMGFITGYKGIDLLIEGVESYISQYGDDIKLIVLGAHHPKLKDDEAYKTEYARLKNKAESKLGKNVDWQEGFVDGKKMALYYPASDVVMFPYTRSISSSGPMALSIGYETPFLASDVFAESIDDSELLFEKTGESMAKRVKFFFENQDHYITKVKTMREELLWSNIGKLTYTVYKK